MAGQFACLVLTSQGERIIGRELVSVGTDAAANWTWREETQRRVFRQEEPSAQERVSFAKAVAPLRGSDIAAGEGLGLTRHGKLWALYRLEFEEDRVSVFDVFDSNADRLWAFERLMDVAERYLLDDKRAR